MVSTVQNPTLQKPAINAPSSNGADSGKKTALEQIEYLLELPLTKLQQAEQKLSDSKNPFLRWISDIGKSFGLLPDETAKLAHSAQAIEERMYIWRTKAQDSQDLTPENIINENEIEIETLVNSRDAEKVWSIVANDLGLLKPAEVEGESAELNAFKLFFTPNSKISKAIDKKTQGLDNTTNNKEDIAKLAKFYSKQGFQGIAQFFSFGIFPSLIGPFFLDKARLFSQMGVDGLSKVFMALALGFFSTQSIAIGKTVTNLNYSGLGNKLKPLIAPLLFLTWFSHIFASFARIGGVFFDVPPEEEKQPNAFTGIKKFLSKFFFKPTDTISRLVNSSSFALFTAKDLSELNLLKNSPLDKNSFAYKTELGVLHAKTGLNAFATVGSTISNIANIFIEQKQEHIYKQLEPLIKLINGDNVEILQIQDSQLSPEAKTLGLQFIKQRDILMKEMTQYKDQLIAQFKAGKLSPEKATKLLEAKEKSLSTKLEDLLNQIVALIQGKMKGVSNASWWSEAIGTISFMGILPTMLCSRSLAGLTEAGKLIDKEPHRFKGKNNIVNFAKAYGQVMNSDKLRRGFGPLGGLIAPPKIFKGDNKISHFAGKLGTAMVWAEIPFAGLMIAVSLLKLCTSDNSPIHSKDLQAFLDKHKGFLNGLETVSNFAMIT